MSVTRDENVCTITFEDDNWKEETTDVFSVTDGEHPFYSSDTWTYDNKNTLRSGVISDNQTSEITISVKYVMDGKINLNYAVSSEAKYDILHIFIDGEEVVTTSGLYDFVEFEQDISAGNHTIVIQYTKDGSQSRYKDACAIGYITFTGVAQPYEKRYLLSDFNGNIYTVIDETVTQVSEITKADLEKKGTFFTYGFIDNPSSDLLTALVKPVVYRWTDKDTKLLKANVKGIPKSQVISGIADLSHSTINGILSITSVYSGNVSVSYSYDESSYTETVSMEEFLSTDVNALYSGAIDKKIYFKFVLEDTNASLTNFIITYKNG